MGGNDRHAPLQGLFRLALLALVLCKTLNLDLAAFKARYDIGHTWLPSPHGVGLAVAIYLLVSALLCFFVQADWRNLTLTLLDFVAAAVLFLAYPAPIWSLLFGLAVLGGFETSAAAGMVLGVALMALVSAASLAMAGTAITTHVPMIVAVIFLAMLAGSSRGQQAQIRQQKDALLHVIEASQALGSKATLEDVMQIVCNMVKALFRADTVAVYMLDEEKPEEPMLRARGVESPNVGDFTDFNPEVTASVLSHVMKEREGKRFDDFNACEDEERVIPQDKDYRSAMVAPLLFEGKALGSMFTSLHLPGKYTEEVFHLYTLLTAQVAVAVRNVQLHQGMAALAITDSLSGLYTHGYFQDHLGKEITKAKYNNQATALMIMDMDFFKKVNDNYGHPQGDALLRQLGSVIRSVVRPMDTVCRYGGDEFTITMPETNRIAGVVVAERIRQAVEEYEFVIGSHIVHITVSGGVAAFPEDAETKKELIDKADQAMYEAKHKGRNKVCFAA